MKKKTWIYILLAVVACVGVAAVFIYRHMTGVAAVEEEETVAPEHDEALEAPAEAEAA